MNIKGKKVTLRAIERTDLPLLQKWANDPELQDIMGIIHFPSSMDFHEAWFEKLKTDQLNQRFAVETQEHGLIGLSSIINIDWRNRHAWHGTMIGETTCRGIGLGVDTIETTLKYAFEELNLNRLDSSIIEYNKPSISAYCHKIGWEKIGLREGYFYRKGRYWDQILIGMTAEQYAEKRTNKTIQN